MKTLAISVYLCAFIAICGAVGTAHADYLQTYVATTCDSSSGRGMVRFGYGDADDPPKFSEVSPEIDGGLSKIPVTNADKLQASCSLPDGREIKIRYVPGSNVADTLGLWSVWVDKVRILHGDANTSYPFAVIVEKTGYRVCNFHLAKDQWAYDLTASVPPRQARPTPIECDKVLSPLGGSRDFVEYPAPHSESPPRPGSLYVTHASDREFCETLISKEPSEASEQTTKDSLDLQRLGTEVEDWNSLTYIRPQAIGATEHFETQRLDLTNSGVAVPVYRVGSGHTFTTTFFIVPPATVSLEQVRVALSAETDFSEIPAIARKYGWIVIGWKPSEIDDPFEMAVIHGPEGTYLMGSPEHDTDPAAVLWKPQRDGSLKLECIFQVVRPHL
jgi:hypothetical protein